MQASTLLGLTGLINMYIMLANAFPEVRAGAREQAVSAAVDIASISEGFREGDYGYLDGTLSVSPVISLVLYAPTWLHGFLEGRKEGRKA